VMQKERAGAFREGTQVPNLGLPSADIEKREIR
jgi:hypothetical protein